MSVWTSLLLYPFVPTTAARRLCGSRLAIALPLLTLSCLASYLWMGGAAGADVGITVAAVLRLMAGTVLGGVGASWVAARMLGRTASLRDLLGPAAGAAAWAPIVFLGFLWLGERLDAGHAAGLYAGLGVLIWGIAAGFGIIAANEEPEPGKLLVASCLGFGGAVLGAWVAHTVPPAMPVRALPAPVSQENFEAGRILLVRTGPQEHGESYLFLRSSETGQVVLAKRSGNGDLEAIGKIRPESGMLRNFDVLGRVFFQLSGPYRGSVSSDRQRRKSSRNRTFYRPRRLPVSRHSPYN